VRAEPEPDRQLERNSHATRTQVEPGTPCAISATGAVSDPAPRRIPLDTAHAVIESFPSDPTFVTRQLGPGTESKGLLEEHDGR
jgi:hypothetical protein